MSEGIPTDPRIRSGIEYTLTLVPTRFTRFLEYLEIKSRAKAAGGISMAMKCDWGVESGEAKETPTGIELTVSPIAPGVFSNTGPVDYHDAIKHRGYHIQTVEVGETQ